MSSFTFDQFDRLVIGTIGMPGEREFYLQISFQGSQTSFALEKGQAAALAERMKELLKELRRRDSAVLQASSSVVPDDEPLVLPIDSEFPLGEMSLIWVEESEEVIFEGASADSNLPGTITARISIPQAIEFVRRTERVVSSGRAPCPFCGLPLNIEGHLCPRANGYRR